MPLIKNGRFAEDPFAKAADGAALPDGPVAVSLARFRAEREALLARNSALGVVLKSDQSPMELGGDVKRLALVALEFPGFRDGRAFSWARMLRTRLGFAGEIRATGHFLYDQIAFLARVGVDAFEVPEGFTEAEFARAMGEIRDVYQPAPDGRKTIRELRGH